MIQTITKTKTFTVAPIGKPRMTQRDKWAKRKPVVKYHHYKDVVISQKGDFKLPDKNFTIEFMIPMPKSWSMKKRNYSCWQPHQQKPDIDNLAKAFFDALSKKDETIHQVTLSKCWSDVGRIVVKYEDAE